MACEPHGVRESVDRLSVSSQFLFSIKLTAHPPLPLNTTHTQPMPLAPSPFFLGIVKHHCSSPTKLPKVFLPPIPPTEVSRVWSSLGSGQPAMHLLHDITPPEPHRSRYRSVVCEAGLQCYSG